MILPYFQRGLEPKTNIHVRITIHNASWDYAGRHPRHGTRVTSLAEKPFFEADAPTRRQALGLLDESEKEELVLYGN
jgi:hypothetical protein